MDQPERCTNCNTAHPPTESCDATLVRARYTELMGNVVAPTSPSMALVEDESLIGTTVGSFRIVRRLGRGGMGTVYLGEHTSIGSKVAIKVLHERLASDKSLIERFWAEARSVNLIAHDNIVNVFDMHVVPPSRYHLVMEYLDGQPLSAICGTPVPPARAVAILSQVLDALSAAHAHGVVHRDLKPENVYLLRRGRKDDFVKLLDFGIAKLMKTTSDMRTSDTSVHAILGTPLYMAPEQSAGEAVDGRADLYAVGVMAYYLLSGKMPFDGRNIADLLIAHRSVVPPQLSDVVPGMPPALSKVISCALQKRPEDRFESANDMRDALENALAAPVLPPVVQKQPSQERHAATLPCRVQRTDNGEVFEARLVDLSRGGAFIRTPAAPPLMSRLKLRIEATGGQLELSADVVRHISAEQASAWKMEPGFGVQFAQLPPATRDALSRLLQGLPLRAVEVGAPAGGDPEAARALAFIAQRLAGSHYVFLNATQDADFAELRRKARELKAELEALLDRSLAEKQKEQVHVALTRVTEAVRTLTDAAPRAEYDAARGNYAGVARCLGAGLTASELEGLRRRFVARNEGQVGRAHVRFIAATAWQQRGDERKAFVELEQALTLDPLNLDLQKRYWSLKRKLTAA